MKKSIKKLLALGSMTAMLVPLFGCSNASSTETSDSSTETSSNETVLFATHEVGTSNYNLSVELAKLWDEKGGITVDVQPISPGGMGAPYLYEAGKADITFINGAPAKWASEDGTLGKPPTSGYSAMIGGLTNVSAVNFMTNSFIEKNGVTTFEEAIRQKLPIRIGCSPVGSMDNEVVNILLNYLGVTEEDVNSWGGSIIHGGGSDLSTMVKDGKIDFMLDHTSPTSSTMTEIAMTCDVTFMQWEPETVEYFVKEKGFQRVTVPANSFSGQPTDITNPGTPDCLFVSSSLDEETVYNLTKLMCENRDYLVGLVGSVEPFDPSTSWEPEKNGGIALHPGAEKYYKEAGYIK
ncbi:MAG: TAXI family TRAP transporter solute-binding subunit [Lachnospirales bacterium]